MRMPVDPGIGTTHLCHRISECVLMTGTRSAESIMASGHGAPHQQAGHMAAPTSLASPSKKTLAKAEPSTHGTKMSQYPRSWADRLCAPADIAPPRHRNPRVRRAARLFAEL